LYLDDINISYDGIVSEKFDNFTLDLHKVEFINYWYAPKLTLCDLIYHGHLVANFTEV